MKCGASENLQLDHVVPLSKGGDNTLRNAQVLCGPCNQSKGGWGTEDYRDPTKGLLVDVVIG